MPDHDGPSCGYALYGPPAACTCGGCQPPGSYPPVPQTREDLFIAAMRHANHVGGFLNDLEAEAHKELTDDGPNSPALEAIDDMLLRRFSDVSGLHLFLAAGNLGIELPPDLRGEDDDPCQAST